MLFQDAAGATIINYTGLKVTDADGKTLASRFEAAGEKTVRLFVDDRTARYPVTIDPIAQQAYVKSGNNGGPSSDGFGNSVAVSGDTVVVGSPFEDSSTTGINSVTNESANASGAAYVFTGFKDVDDDGLRDAWELSYWSTTTGHGPLDDFDHDGYIELLELAFGLNPTLPSAGGLPAATNEGGYLTMTITKQAGVTYEVQSAGTLLTGQPDSFSAASTAVITKTPRRSRCATTSSSALRPRASCA